LLYSREVHRKEQAATSPLLWTTWHWKDIYDSRCSSTDIWSRVSETDPRGEFWHTGIRLVGLTVLKKLNASDERGIDVVREQIKQFAETRTLFSKGYKLIILDEADMMTQQAQAALRRVIELYTKNVRFCIICNYVNKIIPAIQSRCTRFRFSPLPMVEVEKRLNGIIEAEK
jgi:hypothetical protein